MTDMGDIVHQVKPRAALCVIQVGALAADVDNYLVEGNICYNANTFLIGGGKPSHHIRVFRNALYRVNMQLGYDAPSNEDCEVRESECNR